MRMTSSWRQDDSDAGLLAAARNDPEAFRALYDRYSGRIHAFLARRTHDHHASLDLTAETFARAWIGRRRFRDRAGGSAGPWLFAIARNVLASSTEKGRLESGARMKLGILVERPEDWEGAASVEGLGEAMADLPAGQRRALELRVLQGHAYGQVAKELGCSATAARIRVSRGLAALRQALEGGTQ